MRAAAMSHTPSASFCDSARTGGAVAMVRPRGPACRDADVRLDGGERDLHGVVGHHETRVALVDVQHRRIFHAAEILVIEVAQLVQHVAVDGVGHPRVDQREQILIVERPDDSVLAHQHERDQRLLPIGCHRARRTP